MMKKYLPILGLFMLPFISASADGGFDLYYLFVENVFGGLIYATIGFSIIFIILGMFARMSFTLLIMLVSLFVMVSFISMTGITGFLIFFVAGVLVFAYGVMRVFGG